MTAYKWQFAPRFRRISFGWKSDTPIQRIKEALVEIKAVAKKEPLLAAEGAVLFLEKLAPAIEQVDSSSGGIGSAVNRAIETLVPIIAKMDVTRAVREKWLDRLWEALQEDSMPYLEYLGEFWGELCTTPEIAAKWADDLAPTVTTMWDHCASTGEYGYFRGTTACLSALYAAGRHDELLALIAKSEYRHKSWHYRIWGAKALAKMGKRDEAIQYAQESKGLNEPLIAIAEFCEGVLLDAGFVDEAYARYAVAATYPTTNLATFKAIVKKYPGKPQETILRDLWRAIRVRKENGSLLPRMPDSLSWPSSWRIGVRQTRGRLYAPPRTMRWNDRICVGGWYDRATWHREWVGDAA